ILLAAGCAARPSENAMQASPAPPLRPIAPGPHQVQPLPFDPSRLNGLSQRLMVSHHDNNYAGAVKNLNKVEEALAGLARDAPPFLVAGLRERELTFTNSMILHEAYFGNLGGDGKPDGPVVDALAAACGSRERWEQAFRAAASGLYGGSGWVVVDANLHDGPLRTYAGAGPPMSGAARAPTPGLAPD